MNRPRRTVVALVASLLLGLLGAAAVEAPAYAAATCSGNACVGHDPQTTYSGCLSNTTHGSGTAYYAGVAVATGWNYYSYTCNANWARGQLTSTAVSRGYKLQVQIATYAPPNNTWQSMCTPGTSSDQGLWVEDCSGLYGGSLALYTDMVNGTNLTYGTISVWDSTGTTVLARLNINL